MTTSNRLRDTLADVEALAGKGHVYEDDDGALMLFYSTEPPRLAPATVYMHWVSHMTSMTMTTSKYLVPL